MHAADQRVDAIDEATVRVAVAALDRKLGRRDLRVHRILEGTNEIMRVVLGRSVAARFTQDQGALR